MKSKLILRHLTPEDLAFADSLRELAGWNQTLDDWRGLLELSPEGCFLAEWDGAPAGTITTICYAQELAWIGMLLVHPDFRGRGIGRALLGRSVEYLRGREVGCMKLDATPQGKLLYDRFGFREEWSLTRWQITVADEVGHSRSVAQVSKPAVYGESDADFVEQLDAKAFGVSRQFLLQRLRRGSRRALVHRKEGNDGYGILREGSLARYLGPVAALPQCGASLVKALLGQSNGLIYWDIPDPNVQAVALAKDLGFTPQRRLMRMFLGTNQSGGNPSCYFGIADPALG